MNFLSCNKNVSNASCYSSVNDIPDVIFKQLTCLSNLYFNPEYLEALEKNNTQIQFAYIILFNEANEAIGFTTFQIVDFHLDSVQNGMESIIEKVKCIGRRLKILSKEKHFKIITCGNIFVTGEHGVYIHPNQDKKKVFKQFIKALLLFVNTDPVLKNEIDAFMIKDFNKESLLITNELHNEGYYSFKVEPNMIMKLNENWTTFEDYLTAMKTKFRVKAKRALTQSAELIVKDIDAFMVEDLLPEMTHLYKKVSNNAGFNLGTFNLATYKTLKENLGDKYVLKGYWLNNSLIGFMSGIINQNTLDAHFVGINYDLNRQYAIYQRMLYDYIDLAISKKLKTVSFGRTASEIKSSIGAEPQEMTIYLRHKKSIPNKILSLFLKKIQPTEFRQNFPFKDNNFAENE